MMRLSSFILLLLFYLIDAPLLHAQTQEWVIPVGKGEYNYLTQAGRAHIMFTIKGNNVRPIRSQWLSVDNRLFIEIDLNSGRKGIDEFPPGSTEKFQKKWLKKISKKGFEIIELKERFPKEGLSYAILMQGSHPELGNVFVYQYVFEGWNKRLILSVYAQDRFRWDWEDAFLEDLISSVQFHFLQQPSTDALSLNREIRRGNMHIPLGKEGFAKQIFHEDMTLVSVNQYGLIWNFMKERLMPDCYLHEYRIRDVGLNESDLELMVQKWMEEAFRIEEPYEVVEWEQVMRVSAAKTAETMDMRDWINKRSVNMLYYLKECDGFIYGLFLSCRNCNCSNARQMFRQIAEQAACEARFTSN